MGWWELIARLAVGMNMRSDDLEGCGGGNGAKEGKVRKARTT